MGCAGALVEMREGWGEGGKNIPLLPTVHAGGWGLHACWRSRGCGIILGRSADGATQGDAATVARQRAWPGVERLRRIPCLPERPGAYT